MRSARLVRNTVANIIAQAVATMTALITLPIMLDAFGQSVYGVFVIAGSVVGLAAMFDLGVGITTVRNIAAQVERVRRGEGSTELSETVGAAVALYGAMGVVVALVLAGLGAYAQQVFAVDATQAQLLRLMLWVYAGAQLLVWPANVGRLVLGGLQRYDWQMWVTIGQTVANAAAIVVVLALGQGPLVLTALYALTSLAAGGAVVVLARRALPHGSVPRTAAIARTDLDKLRQVVGVGLPVFTIQIAALLMRQQTDRIVLGMFLGAAAVAIYEVAAKMSALVAQMNDLATSALLPYVSGLDAAGEKERTHLTFLYGSRYMGLLIVPVLVMLTVWAPQIVGVWVGGQIGDGSSQASLAARLLILSQFGLTLYMVADSLLISRGRFGKWAPYAVALAIFNVGVSIALVGRFGIAGVAAGTLAATVLEAPLYVRFVLRETGVSLSEWVRSTVGPALVATALTAALAVTAANIAPLTSLIQLALAAAAVLGAAYLATYGAIITKEERATIRSLLSRLVNPVS